MQTVESNRENGPMKDVTINFNFTQESSVEKLTEGEFSNILEIRKAA